jgi:protein phosphatase
MGSILPKPDTSKVVERHNFLLVSAAVCTLNGHRMSLEDAHCMYSSPPEAAHPQSIFGVFDGHCNATCAEFVAKRLPKLIERLPRPLSRTSIEQTFVELDAAYLDEDRDGGSTAAVAIIEPLGVAALSCTICNLGDSRVLVLREGALAFVSRDHKPTDLLERERIEAAGGRVDLERVGGNLGVSRSFGDARYKGQAGLEPGKQIVSCVPEISQTQLRPDDLVVIACDGVFEGSFTNEDVCRLVSSLAGPDPLSAGVDLGVVAARVCDEALVRGSKDNITCMIIRVCPLAVDALQRFGERSYVPGAIPLSKNDEKARAAFSAMCALGGVTPAAALARRYDLLVNRNALFPPRFTDLEARAFDTQTDEESSAEMQFFGAGPPLEAMPEERLLWFDRLWAPAQPPPTIQQLLDDDDG